jgi:hypothetical protein
LFELFSSGQKGIFSTYASPFSQPIAPAMNLKKGLAYLENLLFLPPTEQLKQLLYSFT